MKKKNIEDVKNSKYFTLWDIVPYACVLVIAVALLFIFFLPGKDDMKGFRVVYGDTEIMSYDFAKDEFYFSDGFEDAFDIKEDKYGYTVNVKTDDGINVFFIDKKEKTVKMTDADCSYSQDCTYMPKLEKSGDSIICVPNKIKLIADGEENFSPVTG